MNEYSDNLNRAEIHMRNRYRIFLVIVFIIGLVLGLLLGISPKASAEPGVPCWGETCTEEPYCDFSEYEREIARLKEEKAYVVAKVDGLNDKVYDLTRLSERLTDENNDLEYRLGVQLQENLILNNEVSNLNWRITEQSTKITRQQATIQRLRDRLRRN